MSDDTNSDGPDADNYGIEPPPPLGQIPGETPGERPPSPHGPPAYGGPMPERQRPPSYVRWVGGCLIASVVLLVICGSIVGVLAGIALSSAPATATVEKTFTVGGTATLVIHSAAGSVHVTPSSDGQIHLHATKRARGFTHSQAQSDLDTISVTTSQTGNVVDIRTEITGGGVNFGFLTRQVDLDVTAPANTTLSVVENAGTLDASGLTGKLTAQVNAGAVTMDSMTMASGSSLHVNAGSLALNGALQPGASLLVEVNAGSADLTLPKGTSAHLEASASAGSLNINGWSVNESHNGANTTASGDLNPNPTGSITIHVSAGSATLNAA